MSYLVGDFYREHGVNGIVVHAYSGGLHGTIMSLDESRQLWCEDGFYKSNGNTSWGVPKGIKTSATSLQDGFDNCRRICDSFRQIESKFPALNWALGKGSGWYIPAIQQWKSFFPDIISIEKINKLLINVYAAPLFNSSNDWQANLYWSSTEAVTNQFSEMYGIEQSVFAIAQTHTQITSDLKNSRYCIARAFADF